MTDPRAAILEEFRGNRFMMHEVLFGHRHEDESPDFHRDIVAAFWSLESRGILVGFRGCAKSTRAEEFVTLAAAERLFRNCIFLGPSETRAAERLASVANELKMNDDLRDLFGELTGPVWTQTKLVLNDGRCIQAMGRDQDIRGIKHLDWRPDLIVVDDFEDKDNALTPEGRRKTLRWFLRELLPACDPRRRIVVLATLMHAESVPVQLVRIGWPQKVFPIAYLDESGAERPIWPARFPLKWIEENRRDYRSLGEGDVWELEFMCDPTTQTDKTFTDEMIHVEPRARTWEAVYAMIDPARTTRRTSSLTGWAVWSWVRNRLIIWEADNKPLMPDEIIDLTFRLAHEYTPIEVGIEDTGLNEWLSQPIRSRMLADGVIPYRGIPAPRGKIEFIGGLQPFFANGEAVFARELPALRDQILGFPSGKIDAINALAYALLLKPGRLIYEGFLPAQHISDARIPRYATYYLAANARRSSVCAALVAVVAGRTLILNDWVVEGDAGDALEGVVREASITSGGRLTFVAGRTHWQDYRNVGLVQAARSLGLDTRPGGDEMRGREMIRRELQRGSAAGPAFAVSPAARWTLNALSGGYSTPLRHGMLTDEPADNHYRLLMEGLESFCGLLAWGLEDDEDPANWAYTESGRRFKSALPDHMRGLEHGPRELKVRQ